MRGKGPGSHLAQLQVVMFPTVRFKLPGKSLVGRPRWIVGIICTMAVVGFLVAGIVGWLSYDLTAGLPTRESIRGIGDMAEATTIFDVADQPIFTIFKEQRIEVPLEKVSPNLIKAVLSVEDQRFFEHGGIDPIRVAAAGLRNLRQGRRAEGGSTITQQLARQSFLSRDKTYRRKMKEVIVAAYIENVYTKNDILELYLNKVYFGDGLYGVEAASRGYFGKRAAELTVDEGALLAGLIQSPSSYAPDGQPRSRGRAPERRSADDGVVGRVDQADADKAKAAPVKLANALEIKETFGLYFKEQVRRELVEKFGWQRVYQGGLRVYTTLDADCAAQRGIVSRGWPQGHREARQLQARSARQDAGREGRRSS